MSNDLTLGIFCKIKSFFTELLFFLLYIKTKENVKGTGDSDRMEADMVSLLYISETNSFR